MAQRKLTVTANFSKKDAFNITAADTLNTQNGKTINVIGAAIGLDVSHDTGEEVVTGYLKDSSGKIYSTISKTAIDSIAELCDIISDGELDDVAENLAVRVEIKKSKGGRDFIVLHLE